jgi:hypothetical protein
VEVAAELPKQLELYAGRADERLQRPSHLTPDKGIGDDPQPHYPTPRVDSVLAGSRDDAHALIQEHHAHHAAYGERDYISELERSAELTQQVQEKGPRSKIGRIDAFTGLGDSLRTALVDELEKVARYDSDEGSHHEWTITSALPIAVLLVGCATRIAAPTSEAVGEITSLRGNS